MDMSFLLKQFLPPGVSVEQLQETGAEVVKRILAAAQRIEENHTLLTEQNAMLRQLLALSQAQAETFVKEPTNAAQTLAAPPQPSQSVPGGGNWSISQSDPASGPIAGTLGNDSHGGDAECDPARLCSD